MALLDATSMALHTALLTPYAGVGSDGAHVCDSCHLAFAVPVAAHELDEWHFVVDLDCANCGASGAQVLDDAQLEALDLGLDAASRAMLSAVDAMCAAQATQRSLR